MPGQTYETYDHDGWTCGYRHKTGCEPAIVLLHPVGIGLSSWFWTRVMAELPNEVYAPDFIGCGRSDPWDPAERGLFLPLDYSRQVEELWRQKIGKPCCVVAQGGLAPVGVYLASRSSDRWDGARAVAGLALSAPPPFADLAEGLDSAEVARNLDFLQSSLGRQLVKLLRSSFFVRFFSNLFLFADACDEAWIGNCLTDDERPKSIEPVLTFAARGRRRRARPLRRAQDASSPARAGHRGRGGQAGREARRLRRHRPGPRARSLSTVRATCLLGNAPASWRTRSARSYCARDGSGDSRRKTPGPAGTAGRARRAPSAPSGVAAAHGPTTSKRRGAIPRRRGEADATAAVAWARRRPPGRIAAPSRAMRLRRKHPVVEGIDVPLGEEQPQVFQRLREKERRHRII